MLFIDQKDIVINIKLLIPFGGLCFLSLFSSLYAGDTLKEMIYPIITLFIALVFVSNVDSATFRKAYIDVMVFLALYSIVVYLIYLAVPELIECMPVIVNSNGGKAFNLIFAVVSQHAFMRSDGIFWEPGVYQTFLNLAIPMVIFENKKYWKLIVLYVALLFTLSTTAYLVGLLNLVFILLNYYSKKKNGYFKAFFIILLGIIAVIIAIPFMPKTINGVDFGINKITNFF